MTTQPLPTPVAAPPPSEGRRVTTRSIFGRFQGLLFVLPALVALGLFLVYPAYYTIRLAFYEGSFNFGFEHYLGLKNFKDLLTNDPDFLDTSKFHGINILQELVYKSDGGALINNIHWVIFYVGFALVIGLSLAVLAVRVRYERTGSIAGETATVTGFKSTKLAHRSATRTWPGRTPRTACCILTARL